ncbi:hypothetical protein RBB50_004362 [Rhinocladiella similis]
MPIAINNDGQNAGSLAARLFTISRISDTAPVNQPPGISWPGLPGTGADAAKSIYSTPGEQPPGLSWPGSSEIVQKTAASTPEERKSGPSQYGPGTSVVRSATSAPKGGAKHTSGSNSAGFLRQTTPHDEKAESAPAAEHAQIDLLCTEIKDLKNAIVTELQSIKAKTGKTNWDSFHKNIGIVASLGASITFALIVTDIKDPRPISRHGWIDLSTVRILLATSWILFMAVLSLSFSVAQNFKRDNTGAMLSYLVYLLELAAVMCLAFVVAAYVEVIGYIGMALVSIVVLVIVANELARVHLDKMSWQINIQSP